MRSPDIIVAIEPVVNAFEKLGVLYYIGGSVASSAYGIARATLDVDRAHSQKVGHAAIIDSEEIAICFNRFQRPAL